MGHTDRREPQFQTSRRMPYITEGSDRHFSQNVRRMQARLSWKRVARRRERHQAKNIREED